MAAELVDIEPELYQLRRRNDADELAKICGRRSTPRPPCTAARSEIVKPGINELTVFSELQAAAVEACGEMITGTGNDYASGDKGGPPRDRRIEAGELYIFDLGPAYRGYFADNTRVIAVGGQPTRQQTSVYEKVAGAFAIVERMVRPGVSARAVFEEVNRYLEEAAPLEFGHHLGHGIGLFPHEAPHLNPFWDDTFQAGEVIAVEPGLYGGDLRAGIRLENNYLITETGVELLTPFPLELVSVIARRIRSARRVDPQNQFLGRGRRATTGQIRVGIMKAISLPSSSRFAQHQRDRGGLVATL